MTEVDLNDADSKPADAEDKKIIRAKEVQSLPSCIHISPPSDRKEAGHYQLDEDKGDTSKVTRHKGSMFAKPNVNEGKRAYDDRVNNLKKAACDALDRAETYFQAVKRANKTPSWELLEATELFKLMHNKYAQLLGDFSLQIMRRDYQGYLWNRNHKSGFKSDKSDHSTPSVIPTRDAPRRVEEYLDGVKAATEADKSPPWEL